MDVADVNWVILEARGRYVKITNSQLVIREAFNSHSHYCFANARLLSLSPLMKLKLAYCFLYRRAFLCITSHCMSTYLSLP